MTPVDRVADHHVMVRKRPLPPGVRAIPDAPDTAPRYGWRFQYDGVRYVGGNFADPEAAADDLARVRAVEPHDNAGKAFFTMPKG